MRTWASYVGIMLLGLTVGWWARAQFVRDVAGIAVCRRVPANGFFSTSANEVKDQAWTMTEAINVRTADNKAPGIRQVEVYVGLCQEDGQRVRQVLQEAGFSGRQVEAMTPWQQELAARLRVQP